MSETQTSEPPIIPSQSSPTSSPASGQNQVCLVRKCLGKAKSNECLQGQDHNNTRWECNFETQNKDEYAKHLKNIMKRVKWRDLLDANKPDKDGWLRCVYYSTDKHHVENHYHKGSNDPISPSAHGGYQYKNYMYKRKHASRGSSDDEDSESATNMKKMKDASLLGFFQDHPSMTEGGAEPLSDQMKVEELMEQVEKKLEIPHEMAEEAIQTLAKNGYTLVSGLKQLTKEGWDKMDLPLAIEEELKSQIAGYAYNPGWYGIPFAWPFHQAGYWGQYPGNMMNGQPFYLPYPTEEAVLSGEVGEKDKENGESQQESQESQESQQDSQVENQVESQVESQTPVEPMDVEKKEEKEETKEEPKLENQ